MDPDWGSTGVNIAGGVGPWMSTVVKSGMVNPMPFSEQPKHCAPIPMGQAPGVSTKGTSEQLFGVFGPLQPIL